MRFFFIKQKPFSRLIPVFIGTLSVFLAGCTPPADRYAPQIITPPAVSVRQVGTSVQGRPIDCFQFGYAGRRILILAAIHGNEPASHVLAEGLREHLLGNRYLYSNRVILLIPIANPDGLSAGTRENANKIDLNRNFPADNRQSTDRYGINAVSEPESMALYDLIDNETPERILSIHQPYGCIDYDGPAQVLAWRMALWCDLPVRKVGALPGSLGSWAGETRQIPIITLEMTAEDTALTQEQIWAKYGKAVLDFIAAP
jgi:protein MpaA